MRARLGPRGAAAGAPGVNGGRLDELDRKLLALLQEDATLTVNVLARRIGLSPNACWRRIQRLEADGVIRRRVTLLEPARVNAGVTVFVAIKTNQHYAAWYRRFARNVRSIPEVVEFYRMSGDVDYLLRVVVPDIAAYDAVYDKLIRTRGLSDVSSSFAMEEIKYTTALPLHFIDGARAKPTRRQRAGASA